jgi:D-alanyl-D-alanine dipeptidase
MDLRWLSNLRGDEHELIEVQAAVPGVHVSLRYTTSRNGARRALYPRDARCLLRRPVAMRLARAQEALQRQGLSLLIWDAYRPLSAQKALWQAVPNRNWVAPPNRGGMHNRGAAVDTTLCRSDGTELKMPTDFDDFTTRAYPNSLEAEGEALRNRHTLAAAMKSAGFVQAKTEWWHFSAPEGGNYPLLDVPLTQRSPRSP